MVPHLEVLRKRKDHHRVQLLQDCCTAALTPLAYAKQLEMTGRDGKLVEWYNQLAIDLMKIFPFTAAECSLMTMNILTKEREAGLNFKDLFEQHLVERVIVPHTDNRS